MNSTDKCWCGSGKNYGDCHMEMDLKLRELEKLGNQIPRRDMIRNEKQIEGIRKAGKVNSMVLDKVAESIHEGMTTEEIDKIVYDETIRLGGTPACLGFEGFPKSVCTSINNVVFGMQTSKLSKFSNKE